MVVGRALDRADHAGELDQRAVAHHLDDTTPGHRRVEDLAPDPLQRGERASFVGFGQRAVATTSAAKIAATRRVTLCSASISPKTV